MAHITGFTPDTRPPSLILAVVAFCFKRVMQTGRQGVCLRLTGQPRLALICVIPQQAPRDHSSSDRVKEWDTDFSMLFFISGHEPSCKLQRYSRTWQ